MMFGVFQKTLILGLSAWAFSCEINTANVTGERKFSGAAVLNDGTAVFAPYNADCVGVYKDGVFLCVDIELSFDYKFRGAAAIEDMVVFAPSMADCVGVFKSNEFSCTTATTGLTGTAVKFFGATVLNNKVIFAPYNADCVGQYAPAVATPAGGASGKTSSLRGSVRASSMRKRGPARWAARA